MPRMTEREFGFEIVFTGVQAEDELRSWFRASIPKLRAARKGFCVLARMEQVAALGEAARTMMIQGQSTYKLLGMARSAVLATTEDGLTQWREIAESSGIIDTERYFLASEEDEALRWLEEGSTD